MNPLAKMAKEDQRRRVHAAAAGMTFPGMSGDDDRKEYLRRLRTEDQIRQLEEKAAYEEKVRNHAEHSRPERVRLASKDEWLALFAREGDDVIYNAIATGHTPASYGRERGFPPFYFKQWCAENLDRKKYLLAKQAWAELAAYDSAAMFDDPDTKKSMQAVHHVRARAQHKTWLAERNDAENWGPPKSVPPPQAPVSLVISIDGNNVPEGHHDRIEAKRAEKLLNAAKVFDPLATNRKQATDAEIVDV